ncbi:MAG TPA: hypothetical protein VKH43_08425, partial [Thermoanaerobaculia bacterium]|nr:hypothetical protein [Thermoanaerobaculia bacterium]
AREVRRALEASPSAPDAQRLLAILVEYYAAARFEPAEFQAEEGRALTRLAARSAVLDAPIRQMAAAVKGEVPILLDRGAAGGFFPAWVWDQWKTEPFSRFLKTIGDSYDRADQPRQALARYAAAWALDSANTEAALYAAVILSDHSTDLDPSGKLLDRLTEGLFDDKMAAYRKLDWVNVLRLHTVLGDIFERQDKWGPPGNPRSAVFQWTAALRAESEVRKVKPGFQPSPGLYLRLGNCYQRLGDREAAWNGYVKASYAFLKISKPEEAAGALERSRALGVPVTAEKEKTLRSLESALDDSRKSRKEGVRFAK